MLFFSTQYKITTSNFAFLKLKNNNYLIANCLNRVNIIICLILLFLGLREALFIRLYWVGIKLVDPGMFTATYYFGTINTLTLKFYISSNFLSVNLSLSLLIKYFKEFLFIKN